VTALLETTPHPAVVVVDRRLNILARNRLAEAVFGVVDQDARGPGSSTRAGAGEGERFVR
jgi:hypothetical protein